MIKKELVHAQKLSPKGFHAIAFVIRPGRFYSHYIYIFEILTRFFGENVKNSAFIIFTNLKNQNELAEFLDIPFTAPCVKHRDVCTDHGFKSFIRNRQSENMLFKLIMECAGQIMIIDNKATADIREKQVEAIVKEIERIWRISGKNCFGAVKKSTIFSNKVPMKTKRKQTYKSDEKGSNFEKNIRKYCFILFILYLEENKLSSSLK